MLLILDGHRPPLQAARRELTTTFFRVNYHPCSFSLLIALLSLLAPLRAQDQPVHMTPEFALTFPVTSAGKDVTVKYPIMINPTTVLKPGMVLRTLYVLTTANADGSTDLALAHKGDQDGAYARGSSSSDEREAKIPPELAHELEGYRRTIWTVPNNFILAMAQMPTESMHLIYSPTARTTGTCRTRGSASSTDSSSACPTAR